MFHPKLEIVARCRYWWRSPLESSIAMKPALRNCLVLCTALLLTGCDGDDAHDRSAAEQMTRESLCVAASERFTLYKEAERHKAHGLEAARLNFEKSGEPSNFLAKIHVARIELASESKDFNATFLSTRCDTNVTHGEVADH
jgi:hypothetical protein